MVFININNEIMKKYHPHSIIIILLLAFAFQSCNETPTAPNNGTVVSILSPSSNSIASDTTTIKIQILGNDNIVRLELYINHYLYLIDTTKGTSYEFKWDTRNYQDGTQAVINAIAYDSNGNSIKSKFSIVYIYRFMPVNLTANFVNASEIQLNWLDFSKIEAGFEIYEAVNDSNFSLLARIDSNKTSYTVETQFDTSKSYYFRIRAYSLSSFSNFTPIVKVQLKLLAPSNVHGSFISDSLLTLSWNDNNDFEEMFVIRMDSMTIATAKKNQTTIEFSNKFYSNTIYTFKVYAYLAGIFSEPSESIYLNFEVTPPSNLHVYNNQQDMVNLSWNNTSQYIVRTIIERTSEFNSYTIIKETSNNDTTYTDINLDSTKTYFYRIKSVTNLNQSVYSNEIKVGYSQNIKLVETRTSPVNFSYGTFSGNYKYFFKDVSYSVDMYDVSSLSFIRSFESPPDTQFTASPDMRSNYNGGVLERAYNQPFTGGRSAISTWNTNSGNLTNFFDVNCIGTPLVMSNDGQKIINNDCEGYSIYNLVSGTKISIIPGSQSGIHFLANEISNQFFTLHNGILKVYNLDNQALTNTISFRDPENYILASSKDGSLLLLHNPISTLYSLWDITKSTKIFEVHLNYLNKAAISWDNNYLLASTSARSIKIYDINKNILLNEIKVNDEIINLSIIELPYNLISISSNSRSYWTFEKDWTELK